MVFNIDWFLPDDSRPKTVRNWRLRIAAVACGGFILTLAILSAMFTGWPKLGALAWAEDTDQKIHQALVPINSQLKAVTNLAKESTTETLTQSIFNAKKEQCAAQKAGKSAIFWTNRLIELRAKYKEVTGHEFPPLDCDEL